MSAPELCLCLTRPNAREAVPCNTCGALTCPDCRRMNDRRVQCARCDAHAENHQRLLFARDYPEALAVMRAERDELRQARDQANARAEELEDLIGDPGTVAALRNTIARGDAEIVRLRGIVEDQHAQIVKATEERDRSQADSEYWSRQAMTARTERDAERARANAAWLRLNTLIDAIKTQVGNVEDIGDMLADAVSAAETNRQEVQS